MGFLDALKSVLPSTGNALPGRATRMPVPSQHAVLGGPMEGPWPGMEVAMFGLGCFWGAEKMFWKLPGVVNTAVGYAGGVTPNPSYREVCTGMTGHNEVVRVVFDPSTSSYEALLRAFWEGHDPTQGMRQGNDVGTQYRSGIYTHGAAQQSAALAGKESFQGALSASRYGAITTEILPAPEFFFAEEYHQQYLHKNPDGYCGHGGMGVTCPVGAGVRAP